MPVFGEQFRRAYPGLVPVEARLWRTWLREHETEFDEFRYDVHVGEGVRVPNPASTGDAKLDQALLAGWKASTQSKIDVVAIQGPKTWVIEVEERAGTTALGQLIVYEKLYGITFPRTGQIALGLVCHRLGPHMLEVFEESGIDVWQLEPTF